jgi:hypothetical protein
MAFSMMVLEKKLPMPRQIADGQNTGRKTTMLYRQKFDTFIRIYDNAGYITNKSDFGDRVTDASGAVFLKALSREPRTLANVPCLFLCLPDREISKISKFDFEMNKEFLFF